MTVSLEEAGLTRIYSVQTVIAALLLALTGAAVAGAQAIPGWVAFRSPEGRYKAIFPAPPRLFAQEATAVTGEKFP